VAARAAVEHPTEDPNQACDVLLIAEEPEQHIKHLHRRWRPQQQQQQQQQQQPQARQRGRGMLPTDSQDSRQPSLAELMAARRMQHGMPV